MNKSKYLLALVGVALVGLLISGCAAPLATPASAQSAEPKGITVVGEGKAIAVPDMATLTLGVETTGDTAQAAMNANSSQMNRIVEKLKALNLTDRQIQTSGINLYPVYEQKNQPMPEQLPNIIGYRASNNVTITINDLSQAPAILDGVVNVGANSISGLQFGIKDDASLRRQALADASKQAQDKAKAIADALNVQITGIASVTEQSSSAPVPMRDMAQSVAAAGVPVMAGELGVNAQVQVTFSYQ